MSKTKNVIYVLISICIIIFLSFSSCEKESVQDPGKTTDTTESNSSNKILEDSVQDPGKDTDTTEVNLKEK